MSQQTFFGRIGKFFGRDPNGSELSLQPEEQHPIVQRSSFFRPWARRDAAITNIQQGFTTLADLMAAIRDNLQRQDQRNEELLGALQQLPQILQSVPESNRLQTETLRAIHQQLEQQNGQQSKLSDILTSICEADRTQTSTLDALKDRVDTLGQHDRAIADNLNSVGANMQSLSQSTNAGAQVLQQMRDNITERDKEMERILQRQGVRFTTMLAVAIFLSIAALASVAVIGYLGYELLNKPH